MPSGFVEQRIVGCVTARNHCSAAHTKCKSVKINASSRGPPTRFVYKQFASENCWLNWSLSHVNCALCDQRSSDTMRLSYRKSLEKGRESRFVTIRLPPALINGHRSFDRNQELAKTKRKGLPLSAYRLAPISITFF